MNALIQESGRESREKIIVFWMSKLLCKSGTEEVEEEKERKIVQKRINVFTIWLFSK